MMMNSEDALSLIVKNITIHSSMSFSILDQIIDESVKAGYPPERILADQIYHQFYCKKWENLKLYLSLPSLSIIPLQEIKDFTIRLSKANSSIETLDFNWRVKDIKTHQKLIIEKKGRVRIEDIDNCIPNTHSNGIAKINDIIHLKLKRELIQNDAYFYFAFGNKQLQQTDLLVRFYFNVKSNNIETFIRLITDELNNYQVPFSLKCPVHPILFYRTDNTVLYIKQESFSITSFILSKNIDQLNYCLNEDSPLFTQKVFKGISFAENPINGQSFGFTRCLIISESIYKAFHKSIPEKEHLDYVVKSISDSGFDLDEFYKNPRMVYPYDFSSFNLLSQSL